MSSFNQSTLGDPQKQLLQFFRTRVDRVVPFRMERVAADVEVLHFGVGDLDALLILAALAIRHAVPTIAAQRKFAAAGGLMGYGGNNIDQYRTIGTYVGRILKGEKPSDLP